MLVVEGFTQYGVYLFRGQRHDMSIKEIRIPHSQIQNPQTITDVNRAAFKERGLDLKKNDVKELVDDHARGERILKVKGPVTYFFQGK